MGKVYCNVAFTAILEDHHQESVMISQLLFNETAEILEEKDGFYRIASDDDETEGWIDHKNVIKISGAETLETIKEKFRNRSEVLPSFWSDLPEKILSISRENIATTAKSLVNTPYMYGGRSGFGLDASGFVQFVFRQYGIKLPRTLSKQAEQGEALFFAGESNAGDLAFFEDENGEIVHSGIMLNMYEIIHCYGKVRIDSVDSSGIFNKELGRHSHRLRFIRNILD